MKQDISKINPGDYLKLLNIKEDMFTAEFEVTSRTRLAEKGFPNIEQMYIDGPFYSLKKDIEKYDFTDSEIMKVSKVVRKTAEDYFKFSEKFKGMDFSKQSWNELIRHYDESVRHWIDCLSTIDIPIYCDYNFEKRFTKAVKDPKLFGILTFPIYETFNKRRNIDYHKLKLGKLSRKLFFKKWSWSYCALFEYKKLDDDIIDRNLSEIKNAKKELDEIRKHDAEAIREYKKTYKKLNKDLKSMADVCQELIFIRDYRFEMAQRAMYNFMPLFFEIAKRLGISYKELTHMRPAEIKSRNAKCIIKIIRQRIKGFGILKGEILVGKDLKLLSDRFEKPIAAETVKGTPAFPGIVKGTVKIIRTRDELGKLKQGDILVADMTTPDYMIAIKKAAAIVTNIGGISSHSAIVAREFKIPCIVNTGIATRVFKDGDLVEVDADKGIVRKLTKKP